MIFASFWAWLKSLRTVSPKGEWLHAVAEDNILPRGPSMCVLGAVEV